MPPMFFSLFDSCLLVYLLCFMFFIFPVEFDVLIPCDTVFLCSAFYPFWLMVALIFIVCCPQRAVNSQKQVDLEFFTHPSTVS